MSDWVCIPCLLVLRTEFNLVSPKRDKGADGTIGDTKHAASGTSDHLPDEDFPALRNKDSDHKNEVHALDIDSTGPWPDGKGGQAGGWFDKQVHRIIAEEKRRWLDPNDMCRLRYVIWRGYIYHLDNDFEPRVYTGSADKHYDHAHFSGRYETQAEEDTRSWGVYVPPTPSKPATEELPVNQTDFNKLFLGAMKDTAIRTEVGKAMLEASGWSEGYPGRRIGQHANDEQVLRNFLFGDPDEKGQQVPADAPVAKMVKAAEIVIANSSGPQNT